MIIGQACDGVPIDDLVVHRPAEDDGYLGELSRMKLEVELLRNENAALRKRVQDMQHAIACLVVLGDDYAREHEEELCALDDHIEARYEQVHGTCRNASYRIDESRFHCSECGFGCWVRDVADGRDKLPKFCPNCGRKVVK